MFLLSMSFVSFQEYINFYLKGSAQRGKEAKAKKQKTKYKENRLSFYLSEYCFTNNWVSPCIFLSFFQEYIDFILKTMHGEAKKAKKQKTKECIISLGFKIFQICFEIEKVYTFITSYKCIYNIR